MKATLEFSLPDEEHAHRWAIHSQEMAMTLRTVDQELRTFLKHGNAGFECPEDVAHHVRGLLLDVLRRIEP